MRSHQRKSVKCCWALFVVMVTLFHLPGMEAQPQVYFKASQLPAKSLPRIGRRGDLDPLQGVDLWNDVFAYENNNYNAHPDTIYLWRKLTGGGGDGSSGNGLYPDDLSVPVGPGGLYKVKDQ